MHGRESDWKRFRKLREIALERLCDRILQRISEISYQDDRTFHARYRDVYDYIRRQDKRLARAFDDPRRSTADAQLAQMYASNLVSDDELDEFTDKTKEIVRELSDLYQSDDPDRGA